MSDAQLFAVACVYYDRIGENDSSIRLSVNEAQALREFKLQVNVPSDSMLFHSPGDFDLVLVGHVFRTPSGKMEIVGGTRATLASGLSLIDENMRDSYARLAAAASMSKESNN